MNTLDTIERLTTVACSPSLRLTRFLAVSAKGR